MKMFTTEAVLFIELSLSACGYTEQQMQVQRAHAAQLEQALDEMAAQAAEYQAALAACQALPPEAPKVP